MSSPWLCVSEWIVPYVYWMGDDGSRYWCVWACSTLCIPESHPVFCKYLSPGMGGGLHFRFPRWTEWIDGSCLGGAGSLSDCQDHVARWRRCSLCSETSIRVLRGPNQATVFVRSMRRLLVTANVVPSSPILSPWCWRRELPPKRRFLQEPHGITSQMTVFLIITTVKTSNLTLRIICILKKIKSQSCNVSVSRNAAASTARHLTVLHGLLKG
jgi:hypothetical protein